LPNGDGFQYAQASYVSENGRVLEGNGVTPDEEAHQTKADLESGRDPVLNAAVRWIGGSGHN
jgi:C-terminal processing protease CtpA/Prc